MMKPSSVTQFIKYDPKNNVKHFPECDDIKEINYYVFATKTGPFTKNDKNTEYSRTAPVDKKDKICDIVEKLLQKGESYLRHRSHVGNILDIFPLFPRDYEILGSCPAGPVLPHGEKVPL